MPNHDWMKDSPVQARPDSAPRRPQARAAKPSKMSAVEMALIGVTGVAGFWCVVEATKYLLG